MSPGLRFRRQRRLIAAASVLLFLLGAGLVRAERQPALAAAAAAEARVRTLEAAQRQPAPDRARELEWAARWRSVFDRLAESQDRWAQLAVGLANAAPPQLVFTRLDATRRGESCRVAIDTQVTGSSPEQVARSFAASVNALPHVRGVLIAPSLHGGLGQPRFEFDYESRDPLALDDPRKTAEP
jgi:hypothetical protein